MEKFPSPQNNNQEDSNESAIEKIKMLDIDAGELVKPEKGTLEYYYQEQMRLTDELRQTKNQTDRDLISRELEQVKTVTDQMARERYPDLKPENNNNVIDLDDDKEKAA